MPQTARRQNTYTDAFKARVLRAYDGYVKENGAYGVAQAMHARFGISANYLHRFVKERNHQQGDCNNAEDTI